jgi:hypothetical protein
MTPFVEFCGGTHAKERRRTPVRPTAVSSSPAEHRSLQTLDALRQTPDLSE